MVQCIIYIIVMYVIMRIDSVIFIPYLALIVEWCVSARFPSGRRLFSISSRITSRGGHVFLFWMCFGREFSAGILSAP